MIARVSFICLFSVLLSAGSQTATKLKDVRTVFIGSFGDKPGAESLRGHVVSEIEKSHRLRVAKDLAQADAVLGGKGEVWVKQRYSLNPRSRSLEDAHTVYAGYLSVELQGKKDETLWSYLAAPHSAGENVDRDLARLVVGKLTAAILAEAGPGPVVLNGAGATFPYPVYSKWFESFQKQFPDIEVHYEPVGSEAGVKRLVDRQTDFAASDVRITSDEYFAGGKPKYLRFPTVLGAVVPVYNLPEVSGELHFTADILAGIYLGRIAKWNDAAIRAANRGVALPDRAIVAVHRSEGSGSTFLLTDYLSKVNAAWKSSVGVSAAPNWPAGKGAEGSEGVAKLVRETPASVGYVEYIYAIVNHMTYGSVRNSSGKFISPDLESIAAAADGSSNRMAEDFQTSIVDAPGPDAYPIASFSWFVVPAQIADSGKHDSMKKLLTWILGPGQNQSAALGYLAIPKSVLAREQRMLDSF